jgi:hypothetical protein
MRTRIDYVWYFQICCVCYRCVVYIHIIIYIWYFRCGSSVYFSFWIARQNMHFVKVNELMHILYSFMHGASPEVMSSSWMRATCTCRCTSIMLKLWFCLVNFLTLGADFLKAQYILVLHNILFVVLRLMFCLLIFLNTWYVHFVKWYVLQKKV